MRIINGPPAPPKEQDEISANGYRKVHRFGYGVPDGCGFPLSLKLDKPKQEVRWESINQEADMVLQFYESSGFNRRRARRASMMTPRIVFISPDPGRDRFLRFGHSIPLRKYTSELFIDSPESADMCTSETRRHLRWNASMEDVRHLVSSFNATGEEFSLSMSTRSLRRLKQDHKPICFRRNSLNIDWDQSTLKDMLRRDYQYKLDLIRHSNSSDQNRLNCSPSSRDSAISLTSGDNSIIPSTYCKIFIA